MLVFVDISPQTSRNASEKGLVTLDGAAARLGEDRRSVESRVKALDCLKRIREELLQVRAAL